MQCSDLLNQYLDRLQITAKELSQATGLSPSSLSRYRTGERVPNREQLQKIIDGIVMLAAEKGIPDCGEEVVQADFDRVREDLAFDYDLFIDRLNEMLFSLDLNAAELSRSMNFDSSYLSRIRQGQRRPTDQDQLIDGICRYVSHRKSPSVLAELLECPPETLEGEQERFLALRQWFSSGTPKTQAPMCDFLKKLDAFDLDEYIRAIHFDQLKVPGSMFQLPTSKMYCGIPAMQQGELDFFKSTVLSKSREPVFMCSDMPMEDMAKDLEFGKKWMFAIAMTLKKGLRLQMIHNIDRPFQEMMLGLESWIPLYMTGQVSPYYLKGKHNSVFCHFLYVSGQAALTGECIQGHHDDGRYCLTKNKEEVAYYRRKADYLLEKASPLMEIYRKENENSYHAFWNDDAQTGGTHRNILSSLPIETIPEAVLESILQRYGVGAEDRSQIFTFCRKRRALLETILQHDRVIEEVPLVSREELEQYPMALSLSGMFWETEMCYTYEEYQCHLEASRAFAQDHDNYLLKTTADHAFRNIQIQMHKGKWVMVSKNKAPAIHFVIRHAKMRNAFEHFIVPFTEGPDDTAHKISD